VFIHDVRYLSLNPGFAFDILDGVRMAIDIIISTCIIQAYTFIIQVVNRKAGELLLGETYESS
jgi:hypothetical protein